MSEITQRRPHEMRVIAEKAELEVRLFALTHFMETTGFKSLPEDEKACLDRQHTFMTGYFGTLIERIASFPPVVGNLSLDPATAGSPDVNMFKDAVPTDAKPIEDVDGFAMLVDQWHARCMEHGNRMLEIPEGTTIELEDESKPNEVIAMDLNGAYLQVFRVGVLTILNIFKSLPFGASIETAPESEQDPSA